ncbi:MAG: MATE family efflux transporter, partial [Parvularculaceae bacterium]
IGLALVILQSLVGAIAFWALAVDSEASRETLASARIYFDIRIWGAPFALASYAAFGWLSARGRTDYLMAASLVITGLNVVLDYWFVVGLKWGAGGVAAGTLIAEIAGFLVCALFVALIMARNGGLRAYWSFATLLNPNRLRRTLSVNRDIFIRTVLLAFSYSWFVQRAGQFGDVALAANQTLLQLLLLTGLALDGTAIAAETLVGRAVGERDRGLGEARYRSAVRRSFEIAFALALAFAALYAAFGGALVDFLTPDSAIRAASREHLFWVALSPLIVVIGFQLDGVFIGATRAREMRNSMIVTAPLFIAASIFLAREFGNHGLWAAFMLYFALRGATLAIYLPRIRRQFAAPMAS